MPRDTQMVDATSLADHHQRTSSQPSSTYFPSKDVINHKSSIQQRLPLRETLTQQSLRDMQTFRADSQEESHWQLIGVDGAERDEHEYQSLEEVCEQAKARMPAAARMGIPASYSNCSIASSASESSYDTEEPELSRSLESTRSFYPVTPAKSTFTSSVNASSGHTSSGSPAITVGGVYLDEAHNSERFTTSPQSDPFKDSPRHQTLHESPRPLLYRDSTGAADSLRSSTSPPQAPRASLGQSLGLSFKGTKNSATLPVNGSPLSARTDLPQISEDDSSSLPISFKTSQPSNLAARRKLPPLAIRGSATSPKSSSTSRALNMPHTPGGSIFAGARDGAATGEHTPVSPFIPPTPLVAARDNLFHQTPTRCASQQKRGSLPNIFAPRSPMQRQGSLGPMSPLSRDFAAVSVQSSSSASSSSQVSSQASFSSQDSGWNSASTTSTAPTPPFSPLGASTPLPEEEGLCASRKSSASSAVAVVASGRATKRSKDGELEGPTRPKLLKSMSTTRVSPYPTAKETLTGSPRKSDAGSLAKALLSPPSSTSMEKSISAPQHPTEPKTESARHLAKRALHPVFEANYTLGDELGSGGFGFVVGAHRKFDGRPVAVKFIWKNKVPSHGWVRDPTFGVIPLEAFVLRVVDHPCVVKFIDLFDDESFFYLVMEMHGTPWKGAEEAKGEINAPSGLPLPSPSVAVFAPDSNKPSEAIVPTDGTPGLCDSPITSALSSPSSSQDDKLTPPARPAAMERRSSRDLFECIEQHTRLSEDVAAWVFAQIVEAVYYLAKLGICHRDIKDENCVIDSDWNVKLIDFGSAVISDPRKPAPYFDRFFGTMTFASSEILQGQHYRAPHAEVWSLGVLLSILLSGECPFSEPEAAIKGNISSRIKSSWSPEAYNLLRGCVQVDPDRRATIAQVRDHPWVRRAWQRKGLRRPSPPQLF